MAATGGEQFSLRWNNYSNHIANAFDLLRSQEDFVDVTLCCEGRKIRAHKVLLSACSLYFRDVFKENPCQHPVIVFKNVKYEDLLALVAFMYQGEVSVQQESLPSFLTTAEMLSVQGLTANATGGSNNTSTTEQPTIGSQTIANPTTTTYVQSLPQLVSPTSQQQHIVSASKQQSSSSAPKRIQQLVSSIGDIKYLSDSVPSTTNTTTNVGPILKTYAVQAVVNKTRISTPINIPGTVKLRTIPATKQQQLQQQPQQKQPPQSVAVIESVVPAKKRRISHVELIMNPATSADIEDAEFIVSEAHDQQQQQRQDQDDQQQQQLIDDVDTNEDEDDVEEDDPNADFVKMEIPEEYMDDNRQHMQQEGNAIATDDDLLDDGEDDEEEEEEDEDEQHLEQHSTAGDQVDEQYGIMEASELELMYQQQTQEQEQEQQQQQQQDAQQEQQQQDAQQQQQQQSGEVETLYVSQSSMEETTTSTSAIAKSDGFYTTTQQTPQGTATTYQRRSQPSAASAAANSSAGLVCKVCQRKFTSHAALKRHIESKHTQNLVTFNCDVCGKPFKTKWSLSTHTSRFHRRAAHEEVVVLGEDDNNAGGGGGVAPTQSATATTGGEPQSNETELPYPKALSSVARTKIEITS